MKNELQTMVDELNEKKGMEAKLIFEENKVTLIGELYYEEGMEFVEELDKILQKYNDEWYFEAECEGRFVAYLHEKKYYSYYLEAFLTDHKDEPYVLQSKLYDDITDVVALAKLFEFRDKERLGFAIMCVEVDKNGEMIGDIEQVTSW